MLPYNRRILVCVYYILQVYVALLLRYILQVRHARAGRPRRLIDATESETAHKYYPTYALVRYPARAAAQGSLSRKFKNRSRGALLLYFITPAWEQRLPMAIFSSRSVLIFLSERAIDRREGRGGGATRAESRVQQITL